MTGAVETRIEPPQPRDRPERIASMTSTFTLQYLEEKHADVVERLAQRVRPGGSIFIQNLVSTLDAAVKVLEPYFSKIEVIFTENEALWDLEKGSDIVKLSTAEMNGKRRLAD